jgi:hypothetical protein
MSEVSYEHGVRLRNEMVGTERLELVIELVLWSGCLKNERPLSLLIIARPESGKSGLVLKYRENGPGVVVLTDCTAWGIQRHFLNAMKSKAIHHIIIPDLLTPLSTHLYQNSHQEGQKQRVVSFGSGRF